MPRDIVPRQKNYSVINVDGGSTEAQATTVIKSTKTVEVVNPAPTVTQQVTTVIEAAPTLAPAKSSSKCTTSATSTPTSKSTSTTTSSTSTISKAVETPKPIFITVTVPKDDGPTEYYDNGMWHTNYRIKTFAAAIPTIVASA
ncbi:hypothetical protein CC86DRAFT_368661 [Ophiobolus disseminans]|uniref:Uncharacterized protein n=1 Tax=Ophiobolus disseminans TaxID=1469910 RepID=A0A6A7A533_9PLEO|nr:hypothetical protein CC86DRAFT_368661 [Ophiobolus disseminans]